LKRSCWTAFTLIAAAMILLGGCGGSGVPFNATPIITNLFPSNIVAGSQDFTLFVVGTGFVNGGGRGFSFAYWNGSPRSTTKNIVTGQLQVQIFASDVAKAGSAQVMVVNPGPGGGNSVAVTFTIVGQQNIDPSITGFSPANASAGKGAFTLTINGTNFAVNDPVTWNGSVRTTTFVNATQVTAAITADDIATAGTASVAVATPNLLNASPSVNFPINGSNNPKPNASSLSPSSVTAGSPDLQVTVGGSGFVSTSFVEWNGEPLATAFVGSGTLVALVPATDLAVSGTANVDVNTPAPGGGISQEVVFTVK
jgi:IPT/TIG domain